MSEIKIDVDLANDQIGRLDKEIWEFEYSMKCVLQKSRFALQNMDAKFVGNAVKLINATESDMDSNVTYNLEQGSSNLKKVVQGYVLTDEDLAYLYKSRNGFQANPLPQKNLPLLPKGNLQRDNPIQKQSPFPGGI